MAHAAYNVVLFPYININKIFVLFKIYVRKQLPHFGNSEYAVNDCSSLPPAVSLPTDSVSYWTCSLSCPDSSFIPHHSHTFIFLTSFVTCSPPSFIYHLLDLQSGSGRLSHHVAMRSLYILCVTHFHPQLSTSIFPTLRMCIFPSLSTSLQLTL